MPRANQWAKNVPKVELDQRARAARLHLVRLERLLVPRSARLPSRIGRLLCFYGIVIRSGWRRQKGQTRGPLSNQRSPEIRLLRPA